MKLAILDVVSINISRALEGLFDKLEYRLAKRALRQSAKTKAKRRSRTKGRNDQVIATSAKRISMKAT
jgi:hypothetical protein